MLYTFDCLSRLLPACVEASLYWQSAAVIVLVGLRLPALRIYLTFYTYCFAVFLLQKKHINTGLYEKRLYSRYFNEVKTTK